MHVDETGRDDLAGGIDHLFRFYGRAADIDDFVALDGDIFLHPGPAGAVHDMTVLDQDVGFARRRGLRVNLGRAGQQEKRESGNRPPWNFPLRCRDHALLPSSPIRAVWEGNTVMATLLTVC